MAAGGLVTSAHRLQKFGSTYPHLYTNLKFAMPQDVSHSSPPMIGNPFSLTVLALVLVITVSTYTVGYFLVGPSFFNGIHVSVNAVNNNQDQRQLRNRAIFIVWAFATLLFHIVYLAALLATRWAPERLPRIDMIDTMDKVINTNKKLYVTPMVFEMLNDGLPMLRDQLSIHILPLNPCLNFL